MGFTAGLTAGVIVGVLIGVVATVAFLFYAARFCFEKRLPGEASD